MLGIAVLLLFIGGVLIALFPKRRSIPSHKPRERTMLYAPGSEDIAGSAYHSARKDGAMPFPVGKKKERKRTETFYQHSKD
jgi:hypothetical protein